MNFLWASIESQSVVLKESVSVVWGNILWK